MKKIEKAIFFLLPIFLTIYNIYLINRIWRFGKKISLLIGLFFIVVFYLLFYMFKKKIKYMEIEKKKLIIITVISVILSCFILGINFDFFTKKYVETNVTLYYEQKEGNIPINKIIIDNEVQTLDETQKVSPVKFDFEHCKDVIIVFEQNEEKTPITIKDGDEIKHLELDDKNVTTYRVESNRTMSLFSIARLICSFIMIELLALMLCISTYYLYKKNKSLLLPTLFIIAIIRIMFYEQITIYTIFNDSLDYQNYQFSLLFSGELQDRTPVYPLLIKIFMFICNDFWREFICIAQMIISFVSLIYLYKTLKLIIKWEFLACVITFLYGVSIAVIGWDTALLTESLALSSTILFCYFMISYIKTRKLQYGIYSVILIFVMTFLRPSFIGFVAIVFAFFLVKSIIDKENRKKDIICLAVSGISILMILIYCIIFYIQHDIFSITKASVRQNLYVCMEQGFYKNSKDEQFIKDVEETIPQYDTMWGAVRKILADYGNERIQDLVSVSRKESMNEYIEYVINLINTHSNAYFDSYYTRLIDDTTNIQYNFINSFMFLKFSTVYLILIIEAVISIYKWIKNKKPSWIDLGLFGFITATLVISFIGTNSEFMRTAICVVPFSYIAIGKIISDCVEKYKENA